jgi:hypothetical protein
VKPPSAPGPAGNALERLRDERQQILELFDTYARHRRDPGWRAAEVARLAGLIATLLRTHDGLQARLLQLLGQAVADNPALQRLRQRSAALQEAMDRVEAASPRDPDHAREMAALAQQARRAFELEEAGIVELAGRAGLDLSVLDRDLAAFQEALLSAGPTR